MHRIMSTKVILLFQILIIFQTQESIQSCGPDLLPHRQRMVCRCFFIVARTYWYTVSAQIGGRQFRLGTRTLFKIVTCLNYGYFVNTPALDIFRPFYPLTLPSINYVYVLTYLGLLIVSHRRCWSNRLFTSLHHNRHRARRL